MKDKQQLAEKWPEMVVEWAIAIVIYSDRQKLDILLENKIFNKKWSPKLIFLNETKMT